MSKSESVLAVRQSESQNACGAGVRPEHRQDSGGMTSGWSVSKQESHRFSWGSVKVILILGIVLGLLMASSLNAHSYEDL